MSGNPGRRLYFEVNMTDYTKTDCIALLNRKYAELKSDGETRYPAQRDFTGREVTAIKAFLGPWPRALEAAGIKPADPERLAKRQEKRKAQKRKATQRKTAKKSNNGAAE